MEVKSQMSFVSFYLDVNEKQNFFNYATDEFKDVVHFFILYFFT